MKILITSVVAAVVFLFAMPSFAQDVEIEIETEKSKKKKCKKSKKNHTRVIVIEQDELDEIKEEIKIDLKELKAELKNAFKEIEDVD